jgi:ATP-binding cassette subfamily B protein/subfamily B ATP-binding cassette protein MsbA
MSASGRSSRRRYQVFVTASRARRLDVATDPPDAAPTPPATGAPRRATLREYLRWLCPHRWSAADFMLLAPAVAWLQMVEPPFMRHIVDQPYGGAGDLLLPQHHTAHRLV